MASLSSTFILLEERKTAYVMNNAAIVRDAEEVGAARSHAKHTHSIANGSTSPHHRLHVTVVRWVVQFCFWVMQGQISGKKEEHTSKQYIMAMCWIINHNRLILINLKFSCGTS